QRLCASPGQASQSRVELRLPDGPHGGWKAAEAAGGDRRVHPGMPGCGIGRTFTARDVMSTLQYLFAVRGAPEHIRSDNGPEFIAKELQRWLERASVRTLYIQKASPWENGYVESFNGKLRDELLNRELFLSVPEARFVLDEWRLEYYHASYCPIFLCA